MSCPIPRQMRNQRTDPLEDSPEGRRCNCESHWLYTQVHHLCVTLAVVGLIVTDEMVATAARGLPVLCGRRRMIEVASPETLSGRAKS